MYLFWFIPVLVLAVALLWYFFAKVKTEGGKGRRVAGRTLVDKPAGDSGGTYEGLPR